jgi:2-dehydropantoate 2-reductase
MRILVVGAGAIGGYFGARLHAAGHAVTFLVRARRAAELQQAGLRVESPLGALQIDSPRLLTAGRLDTPFDLVLLSCKAYDLEACIRDVAPAVGQQSRVVPMLNGMRHLDSLDAHFGAQRIWGGLARISSTLQDGEIRHFGKYQELVFGAREPGDEERLERANAALSAPGFTTTVSPKILQDMWEKWLFIAAAASLTSLMRASVGDIVAAGGADIALQLIDETAAVLAENDHPPNPAAIQISKSILTAPGSDFTASMLRDMEQGSRVEADQIVGDLLARTAQPRPLLRAAYAHLRAYETRRERQMRS